ncbi:hypothetical protein [Pedobacter mucosus]|uniref:hypothetical protein n=1 Tax=Pedobacter mucosus TaxID=2895286 RepID=UPI001EE3F8BE|nr:hypothetical protein [Pedobacter mucosus]UKT62250.1 hypothetical protein LOK61_10800 [Pedobacter mucosus]
MSLELLPTAQPIVNINGVPHFLNIKEYESFVQQCATFMATEGKGFELMTQIIADQILDTAKPSTMVDELRPQLKFLKELGFFLENIVSPISK